MEHPRAGVGPSAPRARAQPRPAAACRRAGAGARWAPSARSAARPQTTASASTPPSWRSWTGSPGRLRAARRVCRTVVLRLRFRDFSRATRSHTLAEATAHTQTILATARGLLAAAMPIDRASGDHARRGRARQPRERRRDPARAAARGPPREGARPHHRHRARPLRIGRDHARRAGGPRPRHLGAAAAGLKAGATRRPSARAARSGTRPPRGGRCSRRPPARGKGSPPSASTRAVSRPGRLSTWRWRATIPWRPESRRGIRVGSSNGVAFRSTARDSEPLSSAALSATRMGRLRK